MEYPIKGLTSKEQTVLTVVTKQCMVDYCAWISDIVNATKLDQSTAKGVVGSLVKKGYVYNEGGEGNRAGYHDILAMFDGEILSWGNESGELSTANFELAKLISEFTF